MSISACIKVVYCRAMLLLLLLGVAGLQAEVGVAQATSSRAAVGVLSANEFSGSTAGEQIQAALAALPPGGGLVDARGLGPGKKIISSTIKISAGQTLLLNPATELQPASPQMTMVSVAAGATLKGGDFDTTNQPSFDGKVISLTGNYEVRSSVGSARTHTLISDIKINGGRGGDGVYIAGTSTASQSAAFVVFSDLSVEGMGNCIHLYAAGSGWVNGNLFVNVTCAYSGVGVNMDVASGGVIEANQFVNFGFQYGVNESTAGIMLTGTGLIRYNLFSQAVIWDTVRVPPILISAPGSVAYSNRFVGRWQGAISDPTGRNDYINVMQNLFLINSAAISSREFASVGKTPVTLRPGRGAPLSLLVTDSDNSYHTMTLDNGGNATFHGTVNSTGYIVGRAPGISGTYTAGNCRLTVTKGIITAASGCHP